MTIMIDAPAAVECAHCGLLADAKIMVDDHAFCCHGCRGAFELIRGWGLDDFYAIRGGGGAMPEQFGESDGDFGWLDQPVRLGQSAPRAVGDGLMRSRLRIDGLHCAACVWLLERMPSRVDGWREATVRYDRRTIDIIYDPTVVSLSSIGRTINRLGYRPHAIGDDEAGSVDDAMRSLLVDIAVAGFCAANAMWLAVALYAGDFTGIDGDHARGFRIAGVLLGAAAVAFPGRVFLRTAAASIRTRTPHMDLPVAVGLIAGLAASVWGVIDVSRATYFDSISSLVFFLLVGRYFQTRGQRRAADAVADLTRLTPAVVRQVDGSGVTRDVPLSTVGVGDRVAVHAGESMPIDGVVVAGCSTIDRSLLTGESRPVAVETGDGVEAGTENQRSTLIVEVTAAGGSTRLGRITEEVRDAAAARTPIVQWANRVGGWFVVVVLGLAVVTLAFWWPVDPAAAVSNTVAMLVVACPCALALATPLAVAVAIGRLAGRRVWVREGDVLQRLSGPGTLFLDKTGTLTEGRMRARGGEGLDAEVWRVIAALEAESSHPVGQAVGRLAEQMWDRPPACQRSTNRLQTYPTVDDRPEAYPTDDRPEAYPTVVLGCGVWGTVDGAIWRVGKWGWLQDEGVGQSNDGFALAEQILSEGGSPVWVSRDDQVVAVLGVSDRLRPDAAGVVRRFQNDGWRVVMLSGDHPQHVAEVADVLGIDEVIGGCSPEEKLRRVRQAAGSPGPVVMVGDGLNDAAAMSAADVGVAIRGGASASLAAAPVILGDGRLSRLIDLADAARRTRRSIAGNLSVSLIYNFAGASLAIMGLIHPLAAAVLMPASSLTVIAMTLARRTFDQDLATAGTTR